MNLTLKNILRMWEPRISIINIPIENDDITVTITINYSIPALDNVIDSFIFTVHR